MLEARDDFLKNSLNSSLNDKNSTNDISLIALECLKKSNFNGTTEEVMKEYNKIYNFLLHNIKSNHNRKVDFQTVFDDYIICLEDGKKMQMLKRHLMRKHNMSFEEYKNKWGLPYDYPFVCKNYSKTRADIAGRRGKNKK